VIVPDANLLIYAYDQQSPKAARKWWEDALSDDEPVGIPWIVLLAFTRILTHPSIASEPLSSEEVRSRVDQWFEQKHVRLINPGPECLRRFFDCLKEARLGGNLSTDALIAAQAAEHGATIHSNDHDFDRFLNVRRINPLE
jgi:toxin-antitoxin system PIN domain toxin